LGGHEIKIAQMFEIVKVFPRVNRGFNMIIAYDAELAKDGQ